MYSILFQNPMAFILVAIGLIIAITIHEFAHAFAADKLGDPTPRMQDRLTLDPRAHLDPLGTLAILLIGFGWGKPVLFDPYNLKNPKRDAAIIALAGPLSNIIMAFVCSITLRFVLPAFDLSIFGVVAEALTYVLYINVMLAVFNLVPVHPLDGGKILIGILPREMAVEAQDFLNRYGLIILMMLILPLGPGGQSPISALISPVIQSVIRIMLSFP